MKNLRQALVIVALVCVFVAVCFADDGEPSRKGKGKNKGEGGGGGKGGGGGGGGGKGKKMKANRQSGAIENAQAQEVGADGAGENRPRQGPGAGERKGKDSDYGGKSDGDSGENKGKQKGKGRKQNQEGNREFSRQSQFFPGVKWGRGGPGGPFGPGGPNDKSCERVMGCPSGCCKLPEVIKPETFKACMPEGGFHDHGPLGTVGVNRTWRDKFRQFDGMRREKGEGGGNGFPFKAFQEGKGPSCIMECVANKEQLNGTDGLLDIQKIRDTFIPRASPEFKQFVTDAIEACFPNYTLADKTATHPMSKCKLATGQFLTCVRQVVEKSCPASARNLTLVIEQRANFSAPGTPKLTEAQATTFCDERLVKIQNCDPWFIPPPPPMDGRMKNFMSMMQQKGKDAKRVARRRGDGNGPAPPKVEASQPAQAG